MENSVFSDLKKDKYLTKKDRSTPLDQAMLFATFDLHRAVENKPFVQTMIMKTITRPAYATYLSQLYFIYKAMEEVGEHCQNDPYVKPLYFPTELNREKALIEDLVYFYGEKWESKIKCTPATIRYIDRITYLGESNPAMLIPHNFVRYFGDLSGGQVLKYKMRKSLKLNEEDKGVQFYIFENVVDGNKFMQFYTNRLNALELSNAMYDEMLEEARNAFQLNMDLFEDLEKLYPCIKNKQLEQVKKLVTVIRHSQKTWTISAILFVLALITKVYRDVSL
ncbi:hypothetical protein SNE40_022656 [Patella caerulea]|uniref:Heme oxygenase n=1 Tax=Patella caerulea TaxID=87958 RepID=A0AAN8J3Z4_PATCE